MWSLCGMNIKCKCLKTKYSETYMNLSKHLEILHNEEAGDARFEVREAVKMW
jgi:hypothetical protein